MTYIAIHNVRRITSRTDRIEGDPSPFDVFQLMIEDSTGASFNLAMHLAPEGVEYIDGNKPYPEETPTPQPDVPTAL